MMPPHLRIVAAGRGKSMCLPPIVKAVLDLAPSPDDLAVRLVYLGTATYDKDEAYEAQTAAYQQLPNCQVIKLDVSEAVDTIPSESEIRSTLLSAHAILVSGGNTLYAVNRWKALGIDSMIQHAVETNGPVLCGGSAGAICWFDFGHSDSMDPTTFLNVDPNLTEEQKKDWEYIRVDGLGYLPALCVPHHDATQSNGLPRSQDSDAMLLRYPDHPCIGIDENAALVVADGQARTVSGDGSAACVVKRVVDSEITAFLFLESHGSVALEDLLTGPF